MNLVNKNILLVSPERWDHIFVSKHHYAAYLAEKGNNVFFLNPPSGYSSLNQTEFRNVASVDYSGFPKGLRFYPGFLQRHFMRRIFSRLQSLCNVKFDIVWSFDNSVFFDFNALPKSVLKISHIVDLNQNFQTEKASRSADYCFCTTEFIKGRLKKYNPRVHKINHGFNDRHSASHVVNLSGNSKIKALYSGNLAMPFIDWPLLYKVVSENPKVDFIFVGPNKETLIEDVEANRAKQYVLKLPNSFFIGKIESRNLLPYLIAADILLVAYQEKYHVDQANPHKLMEYLGAGKMIVVSYTDEYKDLSDKELFLMSQRNGELPSLFKRAVSEIEFWNGEVKVHSRKEFARNNAYLRQIERIERVIAKR